MVTHTERFCNKKMDRSSSEIVKEWGNWLRAPPRKAAGQERSRWLRDERDVEWGVNLGNANYNQHFSESVSADRMRGGNQGRDFRGKAHIGTEKSQQIEFSNVLAANTKTNSLIGPDMGELNGLNVEERKRRRGLDNTEYMETEGGNMVLLSESNLSKVDCADSSPEFLAQLAK